MSRMELNKGKLTPVYATPEELAENNVHGDSWKEYYDSPLIHFEDHAEEYGFCRIDGKYYKIDWEVDGGDIEDGFADINVNEDGSIDFHTYHYNGGGHWTEIVEGGLV